MGVAPYVIPKWEYRSGEDTEPKVSIEVAPEGQITVTISTGKVEIKQVYRNEKELQQKDAKTYKLYQETLDKTAAD